MAREIRPSTWVENLRRSMHRLMDTQGSHDKKVVPLPKSGLVVPPPNLKTKEVLFWTKALEPKYHSVKKWYMQTQAFQNLMHTYILWLAARKLECHKWRFPFHGQHLFTSDCEPGSLSNRLNSAWYTSLICVAVLSLNQMATSEIPPSPLHGCPQPIAAGDKERFAWHSGYMMRSNWNVGIFTLPKL